MLVNGKEIDEFKVDIKNVYFLIRFFPGSIYEQFDYDESEEVLIKGNMIFQSVTMVLINLTKFGLIKEVFIVLLNFSTSLAAECVSLNNKPCITRTTFNFFNCYFAVTLPTLGYYHRDSLTHPSVNHCVVVLI